MDSYRLSNSAQAELDGLYLYGILNYGQRRADAYYDGLSKRFDLLVRYPGWGSDYSFISPNLRRYEYGAHSIYYQPSENGILIVRVLGNRQDPARHF